MSKLFSVTIKSKNFPYATFNYNYFSDDISDSFLLLHNDKVWIELVGDGNLCYNYIKLWRSILLTSTVE